ncbi:phage head completion protein [Corynebacterium lipophiloflavum]|uniref:Phage head-tail adaptor n=1 Tax=Corynebacterium lipophiloflavum (strain ATCC 700352 / DSM 44291 / CCUG 37336 / JCM 10383 / DMMZ 1944) TaxID=525263 RepID=C0XU11_CORLD|nr:hypothetical protein [Corynebacterium lipophiloflavum]EEI16273.1 hypothetical protein HMPREF0298_1931 [Corynebacterium lipophiloflavum DSM 44291]
MIFTERITILRARIVDGEYGGKEEDWTNPVEIPVTFPVSVQPVGSEETESAASHQVSDKWRVFSEPPNLIEELRPTDRVRVDTWGGIELDVAARPLHWRTEFLAHTECDLEVIRGARRN